MSRQIVVAGLMLLVPAFSLAQAPVSPGSSKPLTRAMYGEAKPAQCTNCSKGQIIPVQAEVYAGTGAFGRELQNRLWWDEHQCSPDGCPKPVGCGNFWTEKKFIFGSCRQFFGTAGSTRGTHRNAVEQ